MSDSSDDGGPLPGESYFYENINKIIENNEQQISNSEQPYSNNYSDNYSNNNYTNNFDNGYNNYDQDYLEEEESNNQIQNQNDYFDNYKNDYNYDEYSDSNYYSETNNDVYNNDYENNNYNNSFNNINYRENNNNRNRNNYRRGRYNPNFPNNYSAKFEVKRNIEYYLSSFQQKFILWLTLVIKKLSKEKRLKDIKFDNDKKVNKEIIDGFIRLYDYQKEKNNDKKKENEKIENNLKIRIDNTKMEKITSNDYNLIFNIFITEDREIFYIKKEIDIKVIGEIYEKYPKFFFYVNQYKLYLSDEGYQYTKKEEVKKEEEKNKKEKNDTKNKDKKNDDKKNKEDNKDKKCNKNNEKNEEEEKKIILEIKNDKESQKECIIGMCPDYSIENYDFKKLYLDLNVELNDKGEKIKGPQQEIRDCLFEIGEIIKNENN